VELLHGPLVALAWEGDDLILHDTSRRNTHQLGTKVLFHCELSKQRRHSAWGAATQRRSRLSRQKGGAMTFAAGKWTRFRLPNEQWNEIREAGSLPAKARSRIEAAFALYREHRTFFESHLRTRPQRERLDRITKLADDLLTALIGKNTDIRAKFHQIAKRDLKSPMPSLDLLKIFGRIYNPEVEIVIALARELELRNRGCESSESPTRKPMRKTWPPRNEPPLTLHLGTSTTKAIQLLCQIFLNIERLRIWAEAGRRSSPKVSTKEGARRRALSDGILIGTLDEILFAYTGDLISRSYKKTHLRRYVELCFRAVDSNIGSGSIDKGIQAHVSERLHASKTLEHCRVELEIRCQ
jgi:hypothetical protein